MRLATIEPAAADGAVRVMYEADLADGGYVQNLTRLFSLNPAALAAWRELSTSIRRRMRLRRFELVTIAAAAAMGCRYCVAAHAGVLINAGVFSRPAIEAILRDPASAGLSADEVAVVSLARTVALGAGDVTDDHIVALRNYGLTDGEIFDIVLAAAARAFFTKVLDACGAEPDRQLAATTDLLDAARSPMAAGGPVAAGSGC